MDLIDRKSLVKEFERQKLGEHSLFERMFADGVYAVIENFPTVDAEPVPPATAKICLTEDCPYQDGQPCKAAEGCGGYEGE